MADRGVARDDRGRGVGVRVVRMTLWGCVLQNSLLLAASSAQADEHEGIQRRRSRPLESESVTAHVDVALAHLPPSHCRRGREREPRCVSGRTAPRV